MKEKLKPFVAHLIAMAILLIAVVVYFVPAFTGNELIQGDVRNWLGGAYETIMYREWFGQETYWTNCLFGGMPTFQITAIYPGAWATQVNNFICLMLPFVAGVVFFSGLFFYLLMRSFKVGTVVALAGAFAYSFSTYLITIIEAGHNSKANAMMYLPLVFCGINYAFRHKRIQGAAIFGVALALELAANHIQITYYSIFFFAVYLIYEMVEAFKNKTLPDYFKTGAVLFVMAVLAVLSNVNSIYQSYEYAKYTTRGQSDLTIKPGGVPNKDIKTTGLDRDYITNWSYGKEETFNFLIPNFKGGETAALGNNKALDKADPRFRQNLEQSNQYWGDQPFTSGPTYLGAIAVFLFVLAMALLKGPMKWYVLGSTILLVMLSWGKNLQGLTDFFIDHVPMYNKFRTVTIILTLVMLSVPFLGFFFLDKWFKNEGLTEHAEKKFLITSGVFVGALILIMALPEQLFSFFSEQEQTGLNKQAAENAEMANVITQYIQSLKAVRVSIFRADVFRSLILVLLTFGVLYAFIKEKIKAQVAAGLIVAFVAFDLIKVDKRYLNSEKENGRYISWEEKDSNEYPFAASQADEQILAMEQSAKPELGKKIADAIAKERAKSTSPLTPNQVSAVKFAALNMNTDYRVLNLTVSTFNDASTSYFHKSIGGYHGAKLKRFHELMDFYFTKGINTGVINMLNTKYVITQQGVQLNPGALGNAWFVKDIKWVNNANEEMMALESFNPATTAVISKKQTEKLVSNQQPDSLSHINLVAYQPDKLTYESNSVKEELAVFSEIFYEKGWQLTIDGKPSKILKANYLLRAASIPAGKHKIEFTFQPEYLTELGYVTMGSFALLVLFSLSPLLMAFRKK